MKASSSQEHQKICSGENNIYPTASIFPPSSAPNSPPSSWKIPAEIVPNHFIHINNGKLSNFKEKAHRLQTKFGRFRGRYKNQSLSNNWGLNMKTSLHSITEEVSLHLKNKELYRPTSWLSKDAFERKESAKGISAHVPTGNPPGSNSTLTRFTLNLPRKSWSGSRRVREFSIGTEPANETVGLGGMKRFASGRKSTVENSGYGSSSRNLKLDDGFQAQSQVPYLSFNDNNLQTCHRILFAKSGEFLSIKFLNPPYQHLKGLDNIGFIEEKSRLVSFKSKRTNNIIKIDSKIIKVNLGNEFQSNQGDLNKREVNDDVEMLDKFEVDGGLKEPSGMWEFGGEGGIEKVEFSPVGQDVIGIDAVVNDAEVPIASDKDNEDEGEQNEGLDGAEDKEVDEIVVCGSDEPKVTEKVENSESNIIATLRKDEQFAEDANESEVEGISANGVVGSGKFDKETNLMVSSTINLEKANKRKRIDDSPDFRDNSHESAAKKIKFEVSLEKHTSDKFWDSLIMKQDGNFSVDKDGITSFMLGWGTSYGPKKHTRKNNKKLVSDEVYNNTLGTRMEHSGHNNNLGQRKQRKHVEEEPSLKTTNLEPNMTHEGKCNKRKTYHTHNIEGSAHLKNEWTTQIPKIGFDEKIPIITRKRKLELESLNDRVEDGPVRKKRITSEQTWTTSESSIPMVNGIGVPISIHINYKAQ